MTLGGTGKDVGKRHPTLGNYVMVGSGAKVLGPFKIGDHARIAAGAVVLSEVPANATAVGVPARIARVNGEKVGLLDQIHITDPITQELVRMHHQITAMQQEIDTLKKAEKSNTEEIPV